MPAAWSAAGEGVGLSWTCQLRAQCELWLQLHTVVGMVCSCVKELSGFFRGEGQVASALGQEKQGEGAELDLWMGGKEQLFQVVANAAGRIFSGLKRHCVVGLVPKGKYLPGKTVCVGGGLLINVSTCTLCCGVILDILNSEKVTFSCLKIAFVIKKKLKS